MCARKSFVRDHERTQKSARQIRRRVGAISRAARQIRRRVGVISRADRWLRKLVFSHENGYIQAGNDPTASHLLLTISVCTKIVCKRSWTHAKICSTNNDRVAAISRAAREIRTRLLLIYRAAREIRTRLLLIYRAAREIRTRLLLIYRAAREIRTRLLLIYRAAR